MSYTIPGGSGWTCANCGQWVPNGVVHSCPTWVNPTPSYSPPSFFFWPCSGVGIHEFAVGPTHAICNRCEKVVPLNTDGAPSDADDSPAASALRPETTT